MKKTHNAADGHQRRGIQRQRGEKKVKSEMQKNRTGNKDGEMEERIGDREGGRMNRDWCQ